MKESDLEKIIANQKYIDQCTLDNPDLPHIIENIIISNSEAENGNTVEYKFKR